MIRKINIFYIVIVTVIGYFIKEYFDKLKNEKLVSSVDITDKTSSNHDMYIKGVAESLYDSMNGVGTDEERIRLLFDGLTKENYKEVSIYFGKRGYNSFLGTSSNSRPPIDLRHWLISELGKTEYDKLINSLV